MTGPTYEQAECESCGHVFGPGDRMNEHKEYFKRKPYYIWLCDECEERFHGEEGMSDEER